MKQTVHLVVFVLAVLLIAAGMADAGTIKSAGKKGVWSADSTWTGSTKPTATDSVVIADGDSVLLDADATIAKLTVGEGVSGTLLFNKNTSVNLTIMTDLEVKTGAIFKIQNRAAVTPEVINTMTIHRNLTANGTAFDMRGGSAGSTLMVCNVVFAGSGDSKITMGAYTTSNNEFNGFTFNKSGSGKVILGSDVVSAGGSSAQPTGDPKWNMIRGKIVTGPYTMIHRWTDNTNSIIGASDSCYFVGAVGRGMSNSSGSTKLFAVGDMQGVRPVRVKTLTAGVSTGHYVRVEAIAGNGNTGATYGSGIDKVSAVRYYKVGYNKLEAGAVNMTFGNVGLSYGADDGVAAGNQNLRIALADSNKTVWAGIGPTTIPYTTALDSLPRTFDADTLLPNIVLNPGQNFYIALARKNGTTENTLGPATSVEPVAGMPSEWQLSQNYPNPFNPSTTIEYGVPEAGLVQLKVFDLLGREVATLVNERQIAGSYRAAFDAAGLPSGLYVYQLRSGSFVRSLRMMLVK